jgi:tripartite-type tricarboxylate transporter receptor subunit TctC
LQCKYVVVGMMCTLSLSYHASAQTYPTRQIRMLAPAIGGASDISARLIGQWLSTNLGQQVIIDNRGGLAPAVAAKSAPDGYTLISYGSPLWLSAFLRDNVQWDAVNDFIPITLTASSPNVLIVHPSLPVRSVKQLIALAKSNPGELNFSSGSSGALTHLSGELFNTMAGVKMARVFYRGNGPALNALIGGEVHLMFANAGSIVPQLKSGRVQALAVTSLKPSPLVPGLPTIAEQGLPGYEALTVIGMFAPARTPPAIVRRLNEEILKVLSNADLKAKFLSIGVEPVGGTPEQFAEFIQADMAKWGKVIKDGNIRG